MTRLYTNMKIFHFKEKIDSLPRAVPQIMPPIHIRIKPTNICNHNCRYCAYRNEHLQLGQDMRRTDALPSRKLMEILDDIIEMGVKAVTFSGGGEPLCYPHLLVALEKLAASHIRFAALTNGALLKGDLARVIARHGTWIRISMDGWDDASYERYRGVTGKEYTKILNNVSEFGKMGGNCLLSVSLVVDRENHDRIYESVARLKGAGVGSVKVSPCIVSNQAEENNAYHASIFKAVKDQILKTKATCEDEGFELYDAYHLLDDKFEKTYTWCPYLQVLPVIGADANVYACQDKAYNIGQGLIGSLDKKRFKTFWTEGKTKFFRVDPSVHCAHHCVANTKNKMIQDYLEADTSHLMFV